MKIHQLPMGARFEYEGEEYAKTGPMVATAKSGQQRMIPKYAVLKPLDAAPVAAKEKRATFARGDVLKAFEDFYARCEACIPDERRAELQAGREAFLQALDA